MRPRPKVGVLLFDEIEVLDFAGPYEVFVAAKDEQGAPYFDPLTVAERAEVRCYGGLRVLPDATYANCPPLDLLIVPGGPGAREPAGQEAMLAFIRQAAGRTPLIASVCTGAFLLGRAGLLDGRTATTHSGRLDQFRAEFPQVKAVAEKIVDEGAIITAAGVSSGIDLALALLERYFGPEARQREARRLEGPWS